MTSLADQDSRGEGDLICYAQRESPLALKVTVYQGEGDPICRL